MSKSLLSSLLAALLLTVAWCEWRGNEWEEALRVFTYHSILGQPVPSTFHVYADSLGVPYTEFETLEGINPGTKYIPTSIAIYAVKYYDEWVAKKSESARQKFMNCINRLVEMTTVRDNYALYEYPFQQAYFPTVKAPWRSGLSSAWAINALLKAHQLTHDDVYIQKCNALLRGFYVPIQSGGFTYMENTGWWYEEYADTNLQTPRVINGHIYAMLGVYDLWKYTQNDSAKFIFQKGLEALKSNIQLYDVGDGWSYYDIHQKISDKEYQYKMIDLMKQLHEITGEQIFEDYYQKWKIPFKGWYVLRIIGEKNRSGVLLFFLLFTAIFSVIFGTSKILFQNSKHAK